MRLVIRAVLLLLVVAAIGLFGVAIFSDLPPPLGDVVVPVEGR